MLTSCWGHMMTCLGHMLTFGHMLTSGVICWPFVEVMYQSNVGVSCLPHLRSHADLILRSCADLMGVACQLQDAHHITCVHIIIFLIKLGDYLIISLDGSS